MPHQCVRCSTFFDDGANEILKGCGCGAKLFFYIKKSKLEKAKQEKIVEDLKPDEKIQIEHDVRGMIEDQNDPEVPIVLDFESINIVRPGKYELDLISLFRREPLVFKLEEGKYVIDVAASFQRYVRK